MAGYIETDSVQITYKASKTDPRGLLLAEPIIMMQIEQNGITSPWIDAERVQDMVDFHKQGLIDKLEDD